jgi:hypothetical protein
VLFLRGISAGIDDERQIALKLSTVHRFVSPAVPECRSGTCGIA